MADEAARAGDTTKAAEFTSRGRGVRQPADRQGGRDREPEDALAPVDPGRRPGQGGGQPERPAPAGEAGREAEAAEPARPGEDGRADEHRDGVAHRDRRRRRADARRGAARRSRPATPRPRACRRSRACRSSRRCSRSSRPRSTSRPRPVSARSAPSSASTEAPSAAAQTRHLTSRAGRLRLPDPGDGATATDGGSGGQHDQVVAVHDLARALGRSDERRPATGRTSRRPPATRPLATTRPVGVADLHRVLGGEGAPHLATPAASSDRPPEVMARTAPWSITT